MLRGWGETVEDAAASGAWRLPTADGVGWWTGLAATSGAAAFLAATPTAGAAAGFFDAPDVAVGLRAAALFVGLACLAALTFFAAVAGRAMGAGLAADFAAALRAGAAAALPDFFAAGAAALARFAVVFVTAVSLQRLRLAPP